MIPSGLPFASGSRREILPVSAAIVPGKANDSPPPLRVLPSQVTRWSSKSLFQLEHSLTDREKAIIVALAEFRLASSKQLERLHFTQGTPLSRQRQCRNVLRRLTELRVVVRLERRVGGVRAGASAIVYGLDVAGLRLSGGRGRIQRPAAPGAAFFAHTLAVTELAVRIIETGRQTPGFELLELRAEPGCWRPYTAPGGVPVWLKPDLLAQLVIGEHEYGSLVEVDLATESTSALARKLTRYQAHLRGGRDEAELGYYPRVLWTTTSERRRDQLVGLIARQSVEMRAIHAAVLFEDAIPMLFGGGS